MPVTVVKMYERLEDREAARLNLKLPDARAWLARTIGLSVGTLTNLRRNRLKRVEHLKEKINDALVKSLESEIARLTHELEMARHRGSNPDCAEILAAETHISTARKLLGKE